METKNTKTGGIIATIAAVIVCGCAALCLCLFGIGISFFPSVFSSTFGNQEFVSNIPAQIGYGLICLSIISIIIPIVIGFVTLRNKKPKKEEPSQPLPPAA